MQPRAPQVRAFFDAPDIINIRIMPKALLHAPADPRIDLPLPTRRKTGQINVSIQNLLYTAVLPKALFRSKVSTKIRTALSLIVTRGADVEKDAKGREKIVFREMDAGRHWILDGARASGHDCSVSLCASDWTYVNVKHVV